MGKILTDYGEIKKLAALTGTTERTVHSALKGQTNSDLAKQIRTLALKRGGAEKKAEQVKVLTK